MLLGFESGDRIIFMENLSRVRGITLRQQYDEMEGDGLQWREVERVADALKVFKQQRALLDFTDMLAQFVESGITMPLDVLLVDEAQDLSRLQWRVVSRLMPSCRRVVVAGDDDQAIFIWSGADVDQLIAHSVAGDRPWPELPRADCGPGYRQQDHLQRQEPPTEGLAAARRHRNNPPCRALQ